MKYFTLKELCRSAKAAKLGIKNEPNQEQVLNLTLLVDHVLDPAREKIGHPLTVSSGFRCAKLNSAVGGETNSQHKKGEAADLVAGDTHENYRLGVMIYHMGDFDQLIFENVGAGNLLPQWIHVSHKRVGKNRHQVLKKIVGRKGYVKVTLNELI